MISKKYSLVFLSLLAFALSAKGESVTQKSSSLFLPSLIERSEITASLRLSGPRLKGPSTQSYNVFIGGPWAPQNLYTLTYDYKIDAKTKAGFELSGVRPLSGQAIDSFGSPVSQEWTLFHPALQAKRYSIIDNPWINLFGQIYIFIPTSKFASQQTEITSIAFDTDWNFRKLSYPWSFGVTTRIKPTFYDDTSPDVFGFKKESLYVSAGPYLSYKLNPYLQLYSTAKWDGAHLYGQDGFFSLADSSDDRAEVQFNYFPWQYGSRIGVFVQSKIDEMTSEKSIIGLDLEIHL